MKNLKDTLFSKTAERLSKCESFTEPLGFCKRPDFLPFNGDPERLKKLVSNPERIKVLALGAPFELYKIVKQ